MKTILSLLLLIYCINVQAGTNIEIIEWTGVGEPKDCGDFPKSKDQIRQFFENANISKVTLSYNVTCYLEGVALDKNANYVNFTVSNAGIGKITYKNDTTTFQCLKGSKCCTQLPHFCVNAP